MKIDNEFTVGVPIERAWEVLTDLEGIAPCLPGAQLTGVDGDVYSGKVKIKVGPVISEYAGTARFLEKDASAYRAVIDAKGKDSRGAGNAAAAIHAQLRPDGAQTVVTVDTDLNITGKIAQFGSGMIKEVSAKLLGQFIQNLEAKLLLPATAVPDGSGQPATTSTPSDPEPTPGVASDPATSAPPAQTSRVIAAEEDAAPLDLMSIAGGSVYKRLVPLVALLLIVIALIVYFIVR
jgi:carbon monoxide dehydrogenase subunit G